MKPTHGALVALLVAVVPGAATGQEVFHSTQSANLPTATTLRSGSWLFEISHRFGRPVSTGAEELWGVDGPASIRLGLTYQATDRLMLSLLRTNVDDNLGLDARLRVIREEAGSMTLAIAVVGGVAVNTQVNEISDPSQDQLREDNEVQIYGQLVVDALLGDRVALGVVPSYLRNPRLLDLESENALALGVHGSVRLSDGVALLGEWVVSEEIPSQTHDSGTFGVELETRGHFFKIVVTNQTRLNPSQYLGGSSIPFEADELRLGFNITRLLPF
ncbi:MAG: DUF5777 family beta-barrel protein [Longimicrobiales bacterium]|nr:DUF5777 family beta-barrel protein [Longimicrobiales bacterium]